MDNKKEHSSLNLGLAELLKGADASTLEAVPPAQSELPREATSVAAVPEVSEYERLAQAGKWGELSEICEREIELHGEGGEARLWWILSQNRMKSVPATILVAPLEQVARGLDPKSKLVGLASRTLIEVAQTLSAASQEDSAIDLLEREYRLKGDGVAYLKERLAVARALYVARPQFEKVRPDLLSDFEQLCALEKELGVVNGESPQVSKAETTSPITNTPSAAQVSSENQGSRRPSGQRRALYAAGFLVFLIGSYFLYESYGAQELRASGPLALSVQEAEIRTPAVERILYFNSLNAVFYDLESRKGQAEPDPNSGASSVSQVVVQPTTKEKIDTTSPIEPPEPREVRQDPAPQQSYNPLFDKVPAAGANADYQEFQRAKKFVIVAHETSVMAYPSLRTKVVDTLRKGDRVSAESRVGDWLKLRSKSGSVGYILAQDATEGSS